MINNINKKNLKGYWTLNQSDLYDTDIFQDMSGSGNNGTSAETPSYTSDQNGVPSQAMTFNGTTDVVNCGSDSSIDDIFDGGGTVSIWINPSSDGENNQGRVMIKNYWNIHLDSEDTGKVKLILYYYFDGNDGGWSTDTAIIPINTWTHIVVSYDNDATTNNPIFYINGVPYTVASGLTESGTPTGTRNSDAANDLEISNGGNAFDGSISDVMLFSSALTADEVSQLYKAGRTTARMKVDATSPYKVTPKLQKGLILDMPLNDRYTEAGSDLVTNGGFDTDTDWALGSDWTIADGVATSAGIANNEMSQDIGLLSNKIYGYSFEITSWTSGTEIRLYYNNGAFQKIVGVNGAATYTGTFVVSGNTNGLIYFGVAGDAIASIDNIVIKELDGTTKDRTPYSNDGTVEGATLKHDGLVNTGAGMVYINSDTAYGEWEFDFNKGADGNNVYVPFIISSHSDWTSTGEGYYFGVSSTENLIFYRRNGAGATSLFTTVASYISINTDYRIKITRSLAGVFTVYIKGGTFGWDTWTTVVADSGTNPVTDNTYTTSNYLVADIDSGDTISNLKIDGKRISLANAVQSTGTWTLTGDAYSFITDDYISIDDTDDLSFGDGTDDSAFSMSSWVYIDDATNFNIVSKGIYNTDGEWRFYSGADDKVYFQFYDESVADCYVGRMFNTALTEGQWVSLIATYSGDSTSDSNSFFQDGIKIYLNGNRVDNTNVEAGVYVAMENLDHDVWLGRYNTDYTNGQIRDIKVYNRVLNSQEIQSLSENWTDCPSDMVWVDYAWTWLSTTWSNRGGFCIDKYEASNGGGSYYVDMNGDGDILDTAVDVYGDGTVFNETTPTAKAVSEYNANPWISINQVNAKAACMAAGKHLATNYEALLAAKGTPDPHTSVPATGTESCQIWNTGAWPDYSGKKPDGAEWSTSPAGTNSIKTGTAALCVSDAGAYDLIGNVWEWTDNVINGGLHPVTGAALPAQNYITGLDVYGIPSSTGSATTDYNYDHFWINVDGYRGFIRGGTWAYGSNAGLFALNLYNAPSNTGSSVGFRCAR